MKDRLVVSGFTVYLAQDLACCQGVVYVWTSEQTGKELLDPCCTVGRDSC